MKNGFYNLISRIVESCKTERRKIDILCNAIYISVVKDDYDAIEMYVDSLISKELFALVSTPNSPPYVTERTLISTNPDIKIESMKTIEYPGYSKYEKEIHPCNIYKADIDREKNQASISFPAVITNSFTNEKINVELVFIASIKDEVITDHEEKVNDYNNEKIQRKIKKEQDNIKINKQLEEEYEIRKLRISNANSVMAFFRN